MIHLLASLLSFAAPLVAESSPFVRGWTFAPEGFLFPDQVADPRRPVLGLQGAEIESDIEGVGDSRWRVQMGARVPVVRFVPESGAGSGTGAVQLDAYAAFLGEFDADQSSDGIGWDGLFGLDLSWRAAARLTLRAGLAHDSAHVADEHIENTGRRRNEYTREELRLGAAYEPSDAWTLYAEMGHAYSLSDEDLMEPGRAQLGCGWEQQTLDRGPGSGWNRYAALDLTAYEEDDWEPATTLQLGLVRRGTPGWGVWRVGLQLYEGRSVLGEFSRDEEYGISLGLWVDP